jgi:hypothetical protein
MLADIMAKKKEMVKAGGSSEIKVELVGLPSFMKEE